MTLDDFALLGTNCLMRHQFGMTLPALSLARPSGADTAMVPAETVTIVNRSRSGASSAAVQMLPAHRFGRKGPVQAAAAVLGTGSVARRVWTWLAILGLASGVLAGIVLAGPLAARAWADVPQLVVTDAAQPGEPSITQQAPIAVSPFGSCAEPFTVQTACPAGSWPALSSDRWSPILNVAGGDLLRLAFSNPMTRVQVAATTRYDTTVIGPEGPLRNADLVPITAATLDATTPGTDWVVTLPQLDARARNALTFSVAGISSGTGYGYPLSIGTPRSRDPSQACAGPYYYNTGQEMPAGCDGVVAPPGHPTAPPGGPPTQPSPASGPSTTSAPKSRTPLKFVARPTKTRHMLRLTVATSRAGQLNVTVPCGQRRTSRTDRHLSAAVRRLTVHVTLPAACYRHRRLTVFATLISPHHAPITRTSSMGAWPGP